MRSIAVLLALVVMASCHPRGKPMGHPRIRVWEKQLDGGGTLFTIDPTGRFVVEAHIPSGPRITEVRGCPGQLPLARVTPVFERFDAAALDGAKQEYVEAGRADGTRTLLIYVKERDAAYPHDQAEFEALDDRVDELRFEAWVQCLTS
jgi:hypothetical protein